MHPTALDHLATLSWAVHGADHGGGGWSALLDSYARRVNRQPSANQA